MAGFRAGLVAVAALALLAACQPKDPVRTVTSADPAVFDPEYEYSIIDDHPTEPILAQVESLIEDDAFVDVVVNEQGDGYEVGVYGLTLEAMEALEQDLIADVPVTVVARPASRIALEGLKEQVAERYADGTVTMIGATLDTGTLHIAVADQASIEPVHAEVLAMIDAVHPNLGDIDLTIQVLVFEELSEESTAQP